jgi:hypothetical protein
MQNYNYQENLNLYSLWRVWTTTTSAPDPDLILTLSLHLELLYIFSPEVY